MNRESGCTTRTASTASGSQDHDISEETEDQEQMMMMMMRNSRPNTPASTSSQSAVGNGAAMIHEASQDPVLMTTFYPGLDYTWICPSKQMQRKRTVRKCSFEIIIKVRILIL